MNSRIRFRMSNKEKYFFKMKKLLKLKILWFQKLVNKNK